MQKRRYNLELLQDVIRQLAETGELPPANFPHKLSGIYVDCWECHIKTDWFLIWRIDIESKEIWFVRTSTHSDLFK
ncbi:MAG: type II toxin-antitoxin system YafQ family toxin [Porphyromonadaceae bacterium]|nr:type II toxin-antitoxin system YafQ family toxin [Porphyromonadaceae bacterium]